MNILAVITRLAMPPLEETAQLGSTWASLPVGVLPLLLHVREANRVGTGEPGQPVSIHGLGMSVNDLLNAVTGIQTGGMSS